jgi:hypothetical protein
MESRLVILQKLLDNTAARVREVQREEGVLTEQEAHLVELVETGKSVAVEAAEGFRKTQALADELSRSSATKEELITELARIQVRQREAVIQAEAAEDHVKRLEEVYKSLDQRRTQFAFTEKRLASVEGKMAELSQTSTAIDQVVKSLAEREAVVVAVKAEVDGIHEISAKSRADLQFVSDHREDVVALRRQVQELLSTAGQTEEKFVVLKAQSKTVDEVQSKANLISNLITDVRVNLETLSEEKAVVDHLTEKLARFEFVMQEAQNTLRMLSHERELAERIEQSIKQLRTRSAVKEKEVRPAATA